MKKGQTLVPRSEPPKAYVKGYTEFYKLKFKVTPDVLIPRPETELIVDEILNCIKYYVESIGGKAEDIVVMDIGTGSGCIAVSVAKNAPPGVKIFGVDISEEALKLAEQNAKLNGVKNRVIFLQSNLLDFIKTTSPIIPNTKYLILVSNLPYIPTRRLMYIDPMVVDFEPKVALDGGYDGFELFRKMFAQIKEKNLYPKYLIFEIDEEQGEIALQEAKRYFPNAASEVKKDLYKVDRMLIINFN